MVNMAVLIILLITLVLTVSFHYYIVNIVDYITLLSFLEIGKMS